MKPSIVLSNPEHQCVTFFWDEMPQNHLGYRFVEGQPTVGEQPVVGYETQPVARLADLPPVQVASHKKISNPLWKKDWLTTYSEANPQAPVPFTFYHSDDGVAHIHCFENGGQQRRELVLQPFTHGVRIWVTLFTRETISGSYCLQQCLRFTGMFNGAWRQGIAYTPFLSELDMQAMGNANGTLTYARRDNQWCTFPVQHIVYPTHSALLKSDVPLGERVDHGLMLRETASRQLAPASYWERVAPNSTWEQIASGMYWERTAFISNRHPADCIHAWIDFGPLEAGQSRTLMGVVYFMEGSKDDLLAVWQQDYNIGG
jgi:hypothetical protein